MKEYLIGGERKRTGLLLPEGGRFKKSWRVYGSAPEAPLIPRSEWNNLVEDRADDDHPYLPPVHDQNGYGMCTNSATCLIIELCRALAGLPYVKLSAGDLYYRTGGGRDNGSFLEDALDEIIKNGVASVATCPYLDWQSRPTQARLEDRKRFRGLEAWLCPTFDHCYSAALCGFGLVSGIMWYDGFDSLDRDGWLQRNLRGEPGGHAIGGYKPTRRGNEYALWHQNSWTERYGRRGRFAIPEWAYAGPVGGWFAVRAVTAESQDLPQPLAA